MFRLIATLDFHIIHRHFDERKLQHPRDTTKIRQQNEHYTAMNLALPHETELRDSNSQPDTTHPSCYIFRLKVVRDFADCLWTDTDPDTWEMRLKFRPEE